MREWIINHLSIVRILTIFAFLGLALYALWIIHAEWDWVICTCGFGRFLATSLSNVGPELAGIAIGVVTIDYLNEKRQEQQFKLQLIRDLGSKSNDFAVRAARELRHYGWLRGNQPLK
jgi:hypothetical protein